MAKKRSAGKETEKPRCKVCERTFSSPLSLREHEALHDGRTLYSCTLCGRPFRQSTGLWRHLRTHKAAKDASSAVRFTCPTCARQFARRDYLRSHLSMHTGEAARHSCEVCGKCFHQRSDLKRHSAVHAESQEERRPHACSLCQKTFVDRSTLNRHEKEHHAASRPHICISCNAAFKRATKLKEHVAKAHASAGLEISNVEHILGEDFVEQPDFSSQKFYDWLAAFTSISILLPVPLEAHVFGRVSQVAKQLDEALAVPLGMVATKHNYQILLGISEDLHRVTNRHLHAIMEGLQGLTTEGSQATA
ncbi:zinc finger protein 501-like [Ornithodoros turicata]|uniref:zinc finger protein 501-like n=1 Tax=Ornithodoros turicata TaxID=34597 RepID=UPI0031393B4F